MEIAYLLCCATCTLAVLPALRQLKECRFGRCAVLAVALNLLLAAVVLYQGEVWPADCFDAFFVNVLLYLAICDGLTREMPTIVFAPLAAVGVLAAFCGSFVGTILFAAIIFVVLWLAARKAKGAIGQGDVLAISCTALYGSTAETMSVVMFSLLLSLIWGIGQGVRDGSGIKTTVAYVPFLFVAEYLLKLLY